MSSLLRLYRGELPLDTAFWTWAVFGGLVVNVSSSVLFLILLTQDQPLWAFVAGYVYSVPYNVIATVGVWRSAGHYDGDPAWATFTRLITLTCMTLLTVT